VPEVAGVLELVQPTTTMWFTVGVCSLLPLVIGHLAQGLINRNRPA
jgi:hypothetical protein